MKKLFGNRFHRLLGLVAVQLLIPVLIFAEKYSSKMDAMVRPVVLTASGGVSLGAYQAGVLYYGLRHLKNYDLLDLRVVTGASAGSVNGLIAILESCGTMATSPQESLFWKTWIPFGLDQLVVKNQMTPTTVMSRDGFDVAIHEIKKQWMKGLSTDCDVLFGVSATRKDPLIEEVRPGLTTQRYAESFVVRIRGRGKNIPPSVENFRDPERTNILLPLTSDAEKNFGIIQDLIYASTAIPIGFPAHPVRHCVFSPDKASTECTDKNARTDFFIDGGVLDNVPVRLAHHLARLKFSNTPEYSRTVYAYAAADNASYNESIHSTRPLHGVLDSIFKIWMDFTSTVRGREVTSVFEENPHLQDRMIINVKHLPLAGEHLSDFFGFIEEDFRRFDYYLGMYDSRFTMKEGLTLQKIDSALKNRPRAKLPEELDAHPQWRAMYCLIQHVAQPEGKAGEIAKSHCDDFVKTFGDATLNYRALLQASMNLLHVHCRGPVEPDPKAQPLCHKIFREKLDPPAIALNFDPSDWKPKESETDFRYFVRSLSNYGFHFKNLGLDPDQSRLGLRTLEKKLAGVVDAISDQQPLLQGMLCRTLGYLGIKSQCQMPSVLSLAMGVNTMAVTLFLILVVGFGLMILERLIPNRELPEVKGWWGRVILLNILQAGVVIIGGFTWEKWFQGYSLFELPEHVGLGWSVIIGYIAVTFVYYFWHRIRHESWFLWNVLHQVHHSPQRIETITSFYKHPVEILSNSIIISSVIYCVLGLTPEAAAWVTVLTSYAEYFYHMNIKTPHWVGYFIQRPEMHHIHHQLGKHYGNFADLPVWDMLFGTYYNPRGGNFKTGFLPEREAKLGEMLRFKNVNSHQRKPSGAQSNIEMNG